jgi:hypothetical protein
VFVHGQGVPAELELEYEDECVHFLAINNQQKAVGTGRLRVVDGLYVKFERVRSVSPGAAVRLSTTGDSS